MQQVAATVSSEPGTRVSRVRGRSKGVSERVIESLLVASGFVSVLTTLGILLVLASETFQFFSVVSVWEFISGTEWTPLFSNAKFGILPLLAGTLLTSAIA